MNTDNLVQRNFIINLAQQTQSHADWLLVIRFGIKSLLAQQDLLDELLLQEAARELDKQGRPAVDLHHLTMGVSRLRVELGLSYVYEPQPTVPEWNGIDPLPPCYQPPQWGAPPPPFPCYGGNPVNVFPPAPPQPYVPVVPPAPRDPVSI